MMLWLMFAVNVGAETITIRSSTTKPAELPKVIQETVERLAGKPNEAHKIVLEGEFAVSATIKFRWWGNQPLTISGPAILDGSTMPDGSETVFMAGTNLTLENLRVLNSQGHAVVVGGNSDGYTIQGCVFEDCQQSAIHVWNDPHTVLPEQRRRGLISGNQISRFNLKKAKWANDAITVFDQGVTISKNQISDSPTECNGIRAMGRDLLVEHNVVAGVSIEDAAGIYLWGGPHASLFRGNVVRWNHVIGASRGIYLDDGTSGAHVIENVVEDSAVCAIFLSGGRDNLVERNVADQAPVFVHLDSRCLGWDSRPEYAELAEESVERLREALAAEPGGKILRARHPGLRQLTDEDLTVETYGIPKSNIVRTNFIRAVDEVWELMDFSTNIKTDFEALNELEEPTLIEQSEELSKANLIGKFGFRDWDG